MELRKIDLNKIQDYAFTVRELESDELILKNQKYINIKCLDNESIIPTVQAIPIPEGATNGDMIKAMFPTMKIEECNNDINGNPNFYRIYGLSGVAEFGREFWNAPYKQGNENE